MEQNKYIPIIILAGGQGTRLGKLTKTTPKPMIEINGKPFLEYVLDSYAAQGFKHFFISTGHLAEQIESYPWKHSVSFIRDKGYYGKDMALQEILGTFMSAWVVNGDTLLTKPLPPVDLSENIALVYNNQDAGAQFLSAMRGLVKIVETGEFYDMGTFEGLEKTKVYLLLKNYPNNYR